MASNLKTVRKEWMTWDGTWDDSLRKYIGKCRTCGEEWQKRFPNRGFCSYKCYHSSEQFKKHTFANGKKSGESRVIKERTKNWGYWYVYSPNHPFASGKTPRVFEHRLVMEKKIGRYLGPDEICHHINGLKTDNRIENLVLTTRKEHPRLHPGHQKKMLERQQILHPPTTKKCSTCGKEIRLTPAQIKENKHGYFYCCLAHVDRKFLYKLRYTKA